MRFFLSFCFMSIAGTINNKVDGQPNRQPASKRFRLPAESSPTPSPTPAAAFLSDIAKAGAGALWPETPMHGWSRGKLRLFLDTLDRSSGESWQQGGTPWLPDLLWPFLTLNFLTYSTEQRSKLCNDLHRTHWFRSKTRGKRGRQNFDRRKTVPLYACAIPTGLHYGVRRRFMKNNNNNNNNKASYFNLRFCCCFGVLGVFCTQLRLVTLKHSAPCGQLTRGQLFGWRRSHKHLSDCSVRSLFFCS